ncbi:TrmH family RNA methyltransferase [Mesomycoplasma hyopneumoniae]|uniref:TrmH family RNA methyltransferase n=1 Tax=Mesomycoplasma hyopneumoniae TaxID=2099 RepID=UPI0015C58F5F|nr:RNA methyltransferase [Mesomycoplasma hyopneumoniae]
MMKIKEITSYNNPIIKEIGKLKLKKYRNLWNKFVVEGEKDIESAINAGLVLRILTTKNNVEKYQKVNVDVVIVSQKIIEKLSQHKSPSEVIAVCKSKKQHKIKDFLDSKRLVILENIQNPGNLGTIIRNCYSFGFDLVYSGVDLYNVKTISASKGAIFMANIYFLKNISDFFKFGPKQEIIISSLEKDAQNLMDFKVIPEKSYTIIFGNEGKGVSKKLNKLADKKIYIPINFESLNIASANAIFCHFFQLKK